MKTSLQARLGCSLYFNNTNGSSLLQKQEWRLFVFGADFIVWVMNLLKQIPLMQTGKDFKIRLSAIEAGWMNISIVAGSKAYSYCASYISDAPLDLVKTAIQLLQNEAESRNIVLYHDLEGKMIAWYFTCSGNRLAIYIWDNRYPNPFDDFIDCNFELECIGDLSETADLKEGLLLAFETTAHQFAQAVITAFARLSENYNINEYKENWQNPYPEVQIEKLQQLLR